MPIFKRRWNLAPLLVGVWLIARGVVDILPFQIPHSASVYALAVLAIVAGVVVLIDR